MHHRSLLLLTITAFLMAASCAQEPPPKGSWPACPGVTAQFADTVQRVLADGGGMFKGDYPEAAPITCELFEGLQEAMKDDSVRYHFEHLSQHYWERDPHYLTVQRYIQRHLDFHLSIAASAHFFEDIRIMGLRELCHYRRSRPMVCTTKEHYAQLEVQDVQAVRYLLNVLEHTPWRIPGSENATIHRVYIGEVLRTLDLFTSQRHFTEKPGQLWLAFTDDQVKKALPDWRKWLER